MIHFGILTTYGIFICLLWIITCFYIVTGRRRIGILSKVKVDNFFLPRVSILIPVRNEAAHVANALRSVCNLQYPDFRTLAINDRSTDQSGEILDLLCKDYAVLDVLHIHELPSGWLGKNHALYQGYVKTSDEWMLFTDADVQFKPDALTRAMYYAVGNNLDQLTVLPQIESRSKFLNALLGVFSVMLELKQRPWLVSDPESDASLGVGAFNLVKRSAYERAGTHKAIALRPDDDLKLGEIIKRSGGKCDVLYGDGEISLEWYSSVSEFVSGLMKNTFSVFNYSWWKALLLGVVPSLFVFSLPVILLFSGSTGFILYSVIALTQFIIFLSNRGVGTMWWNFLVVPVSGVVMAYVVIRSTFVTLKQRGIYWRGTFYPLRELRKFE